MLLLLADMRSPYLLNRHFRRAACAAPANTCDALPATAPHVRLPPFRRLRRLLPAASAPPAAFAWTALCLLPLLHNLPAPCHTGLYAPLTPFFATTAPAPACAVAGRAPAYLPCRNNNNACRGAVAKTTV